MSEESAGSRLNRLLGAEIFRLRVSKGTRLTFAVFLLAMIVISIGNSMHVQNYLAMLSDMSPAGAGNLSLDQLDELAEGQIEAGLADQAARLYTSGQSVGWLIAGLIGIGLIGGEVSRGTSSITYLITPRRNSVVFSKVAASLLIGLAMFLAATGVALMAGMWTMNSQGKAYYLTSGIALSAILSNLVGYLAWGVFGVGLGALLRRQRIAVAVFLLLYLTGRPLRDAVFTMAGDSSSAGWIREAIVFFPSIAADQMSSGYVNPGEPIIWTGALVMAGYACVFTLIGLRVVTRRDIA
ncbi:ABC transporter permease subunit [Streptomyces sp. NPDC057011]|uniref:ABC transporter permease subunit n=1 Tax=unclassified Streptomyces TaxID=2593676 RepID=UPI0036421F9A